MSAIRQIVRIPMQSAGGLHTPQFITFNGLNDQREHIALVFGEPNRSQPVTVRVHSECLTGDVFGSCRCDCGPQLSDAIELLSVECGILLYMRHEGRGIGLYNKMDAYALQDRGHDTFEANAALGFPDDLRDFTAAADMLRALDVSAVRLVTNNPDKVGQLERNGIRVHSRVQRCINRNPHNLRYLEAKRTKARHAIPLHPHEAGEVTG